MSHGTHANGGRKRSGRVTPSKLRRSAVVAADGVLAIGTGALGGLFAISGGPAGAMGAPTSGWAATQSPLPTTPPPNADPSVDYLGESCSRSTCVAVGQYSGAQSYGLIDVLSGGAWTATAPLLPSNAAGPSSAESVSCPSDGFCTVVGTYNNTAGGIDSFIDILSNGHWTSMEAPVPSDALAEASAFTFLKSVDCRDVFDCIAFGAYKNASGTNHPVGFFETLANGNWTAQTAPQPSDAATNQNVIDEKVSCPSVGPCAASAIYINGNNRDQAELLTQSAGGSWSAQAAPMPSDAATGTNLFSELFDISCATGVCVAGGEYTDTGAHNHGLLDRFDGAQWSATASPEPSNKGTGSNQRADINGVSCTFDGCVAVGEYEDSATGNRPLINTIDSHGQVTGAEGPQPTDAASPPDGFLRSVSCLSLNWCTAIGAYDNNSSGNTIGLIDSMFGGMWTNSVLPLPPNAATGTLATSFLGAVSCTLGGACQVAGNYSDPSTFGVLAAFTPPEGYWSNASDGGVFSYGSAVFHGSAGNLVLNKPVVGMAATPGGGGYWEVASDGGIFNYGDAPFFGSTGALKLNAPVVGMAATPDGGGYWLVAADGGIFNYGDAKFFGSTGAIKLNQPVVGMAATPDGHGYWLVAADGGIFTYGDGLFHGSRGGQPLNKPIVGMAATASGLGYWLVASDGGIFTYGDGLFHGSTGAIKLNKPIVSMMSTFDGNGYWLVASDGGIFNYGDAGFYGSAGNLVLNKPVVNGAAS